MSASLLSLSLGPVQNFIAASRKTRDLWFGSTLLSQAARAAAETLQANHAELIFPWLPSESAGAPNERVPVANKILAVVPEGGQPTELARAAERAARGVLLGFLHALKENLSGAPIDWDLAEAQANDFLEIYAAWWPFDGIPEHYQSTRQQVERLLAGRKALRDFNPAQGKDGRAKSSLDPSRETIFLARGEPIGAGRSLDQNARRRLRVKGAEQLDGISLVKRLAEPQRFVSLARVTLDPFIRRLAHDPAAGDALARLIDQAKVLDRADIDAVSKFEAGENSPLRHFGDFPFDTQLFYRDGAAGEKLLPDEQQQVTKFFDQADKARRTLGIPELPTYVAIVVADGDQMGQAIGHLPDKVAHLQFSQRLATFAARAQEITGEYQGAFVYSGGDDVLAFLPLDKVLCYVNQLQKSFREIANGRPEEPPAVADLTLSVGVAIGHYREPLHHLLRWGRNAEGAAKRTRNALAVSLTTGSSESAITAVHSWDDDPVPGRWLRWVEWHRRDAFPDGAAYELRALEREFRPLWGDGSDQALRRLLGCEIERILRRKQPEHGNRPLTSDEIDWLMCCVAGARPDPGDEEAAPDANVEREAHVEADLGELGMLVKELIITRRIAAAADVALGPWKEGQDVCGADDR